MSRFKPFKLPDKEEYQRKIETNSADTPRYLLEYYYNKLAIEELNSLREAAFNSTTADKEAYWSQSAWSHKNYHTRVGIITLSYPYLRGGIRPERTIRLVEEQQKIWEECVGKEYILGESVRDLAWEQTQEENPYSPMSIDRFVQQEQEKQVETTKKQDFKGRDYVDLQLDGTYDKVREENDPAACYTSLPMLRAIGLSQEHLHWEFLLEEVYPSESVLSYQMLMDKLINRNVGEIYLATSDMHKSLRLAILTTLIGVEFQPCRFHLQKDAEKKDQKNSQLLSHLFHQIYDKSSSREQALERFALFKTALKEQVDENIYPTWHKHFADSLAYLDYPLSLAKQIANTNKLERNNEALRRRTDAIYSNASKESFEDLAVSVTQRSTAQWADQAKGNLLTAQLTRIIHNRLVKPLVSSIDEALEDEYYYTFRKSRMNWKKPVALRINIWVIPFWIEDRIITGGLLLVHSIDKQKKERLIHIEQIRKFKKAEIDRAMQNITKRGLKTNLVRLVIYNRPYKFLEEEVKKAIPNAETFLEASSFLEKLIYLVPEPFKPEIQEKFLAIYKSKTIREAEARFETLKQQLRRLELHYPLEWLESFESSDLLSVFEIIESGIWQDYKITDFEVRNSWKTRILDIVNHPDTVEKTIKAFVRTFKKRKTLKGSS